MGGKVANEEVRPADVVTVREIAAEALVAQLPTELLDTQVEVLRVDERVVVLVRWRHK